VRRPDVWSLRKDSLLNTQLRSRLVDFVCRYLLCAYILTGTFGVVREHANALNGSRFRIGSAQKALNLYLKMLWCFDRIPAPPHCPFDRIVLSHVPDCERIKWTELDSPSEYRRIVSCARSVAGGSLAEWELRSYTEWLSASRASKVGAT
jgi:hypothetical protein